MDKDKDQISRETKALCHYFSTDRRVHFEGDAEGVLYVRDMINEGEYHQFEYPDMYFQRGNKVLLCEHFEFDSYKRTNKGSISHQEEARIDREIQMIIDAGVETTFRKIINGRKSLRDYRKNVECSFQQHYAQLDGYKQKITEKIGIPANELEIHTMFFIEETTALGTMLFDKDNNMTQVLLDKYVPFLMFLKDKVKLDFVMTTTRRSPDYISIIDLRNIDEYIKNAIDYASMRYIEMDENIIGGVINVPVKEQ